MAFSTKKYIIRKSKIIIHFVFVENDIMKLQLIALIYHLSKNKVKEILQTVCQTNKFLRLACQ